MLVYFDTSVSAGHPRVHCATFAKPSSRAAGGEWEERSFLVCGSAALTGGHDSASCVHGCGITRDAKANRLR
jgi:hypothetical protein